MRVLIAGCGDVGSLLAEMLVSDGHDVHGLKRDVASLPQGVRPVAADLLRPETLQGLPADVDALVYLPTPASRDRAGYEAIFLQGWSNLWAALGNEPARTVLVSSTAVYGQSDGAWVDERTPPQPARFNGEVLLEMERRASVCTDKLVVARIAGIYGPGRSGRLLSQAATPGLEVQHTPPLFTNRFHREDAAAALRHLLELGEPEPLYLLSDDDPAPRYEVMAWLAEAQGKPAPVRVARENASQGKRVSNRRLRASGYRLRYPDYRAGYSALLAARKRRES